MWQGLLFIDEIIYLFLTNRGGDELTNNEQTQPKKKKLILIKRKQPSEPKM